MMNRSVACVVLACVVGACTDEKLAEVKPVASATNRTAATPSAGNAASGTNATAAPVNQGTALGAGIEALLVPLVRRDKGADDPVQLMARLVSLLEESGLGTAETRSQVASLVMKDILAKASAAGSAGGELTSMQRAALKELARQIAADLWRRLPVGSATVHLGSMVGIAADVEVPEGYLKAPFSLIGGFSYEEGMKLPQHIADLNGRKVGMAGYMMTLEEVEDIHEFVLVESLWSCCFGKPPEVHQAVVVTIAAKKGVDMTPVPILITGVLDVGEKIEDGFVTSLYRLKADSFKELE